MVQTGQTKQTEQTALTLESLQIEYQTTLLQYNQVYTDYINFLQKEATYIVIGAGTDGFLYMMYGLNGTWTMVNDNSNGLLTAVCTMPDGIGLLGVMNQYVYTKTDYTSNWEGPIENPAWVVSVAMGQDGTVVGVGTNNTLYSKTSLNSEWTQTASQGEWCSSVAIAPDGTIFITGEGGYLYKKSSYLNLASQTWTGGTNCCNIALTVASDGTLIGVGMYDNELWTQPDYTTCPNSNPWTNYPNTCCMVGVTTVNYSAFSQIKGKDWWGTAAISQTTDSSLENCKALCAANTSCTGATYTSNNQTCFLRSGDGILTDGSDNDYAIIPIKKQLLSMLDHLNQQLTSLNTQMGNVIKIEAQPEYQKELIDMHAGSVDIQTNYANLTEERNKIKKMINDFSDLDQAKNDGELIIEGNYYTYILLFMLAIIFIICLVMLTPKSTTSTTPIIPIIQSGGELSNKTYYIIFGIIFIILFIYYYQKMK